MFKNSVRNVTSNKSDTLYVRKQEHALLLFFFRLHPETLAFYINYSAIKATARALEAKVRATEPRAQEKVTASGNRG